MGKKRKGNRPTSKRGHDESSVNRYRQVTQLIPVNRDNEPIPVPRKELAKAMLDVTGKKKTGAEQSYQPEPEQPKNVVSLCERRKAANNVEYSTSQEAKANINYDRLLFHEWSKAKGKRYVSEKEAQAWEFRRLLEYSAAHPEGRNYPDDADLNKPKVKTKAKAKPISTVHNPGISSTPIEYGGYTPSNRYRARPIVVHNRMNREGQFILYDPRIHAPSGLPIKEFTEGKYAPPKTQQQSTEVPPSVTKDWGAKRVSDSPRAWAAEDQLRLMIDEVPEEHWPMDHIGQFLFQNDNGSWHVHTGKVRTAISKQEDRIINRAVTLAFIAKSQDQDEMITALEAEVEGLQAQRRILEFQVTRQSGEELDWTPQGARQSVREMDKARATANAKPPTKEQLVAEQQRLQEQIDSIDATEAEETQAKMQMLRLNTLFRQVPFLIWKTRDHWRSAKARPLFNVVKERQAHRRMVSSAKRAEYTQRVNLSGLVIYLANEHWSKVKLTTDGKQFVPPTEHYVEVRATSVPRLIAYGADDINYKRVINKVVGVMNLPIRYQPIEPTNLVLGDKPVYAECDNTNARMKRWAKWLPGCEERDLDRQQQHEEQVALDARQESVERSREVMRKPLNRAINKVSLALTKVWQFGQRDVYVTPTERYKREENERILRERTRNEIEAQQKLDEQQRREEAEREQRRAARREERRRKKDQKRNESAKQAEARLAKEAAKAAFRRAH